MSQFAPPAALPPASLPTAPRRVVEPGAGPVDAAAATATSRVGSSAVRDLLRLVGRPDVISLAGGLPDPASFPASAIDDAVRSLLRTDPAAALQYAPTEGDPELRRWILDRRRATSADDVVITHGSQQALDLIVRATLEPGATAVVADPAYVGALQVLRLAQAHVVGVPTDHDGLDTDVLEQRLRAGLRPTLVYTVSTFHNPTGASMPDARRRHLADLADRYGFLIVDDDPYGELRWAGAAPLSMAACSDRVITLGTFSKVLSPGLRVGYAVGPARLIGDLTIVKQAADLQTATFNQAIVREVVAAPGFLDAHIAHLRATYEQRSTALRDALHRHLGDGATFDPVDGGMFLWVTLTDPTIDTAALLDAGLDRGVAFVPGRAFAVERDLAPCLRLSFATAAPAALDDAAARLAQAVAARS